MTGTGSGGVFDRMLRMDEERLGNMVSKSGRSIRKQRINLKNKDFSCTLEFAPQTCHSS